MTEISVWQMVYEASNAMKTEVFSIDDIRGYILEHNGTVNQGTIGAQAYACTVNRQGRVHAPQNKKPRIANGKFDFLYTVGRGLFTRYDVVKHGVWEIASNGDKLVVQMINAQNDQTSLPSKNEPNPYVRTSRSAKRLDIERPSREALLRYNHVWFNLEGYRVQEDALNKLFQKFCSDNKQLDDVLLKVTTLNAFYSTNIFNVYAVAKHIQSLGIDARLNQGDMILVSNIASGHGVKVSKNGKEKCFYSFATKYCSHHRPELFPIFDSYVERLLIHLRDVDHFAEFDKTELRNAVKFKGIIQELMKSYDLNEFTFKEVDRYLWQYGKEKFK